MYAATLIVLSFLADPILPARQPAEVGMSAARLALVDEVMNRAIDAGGFPGGTVVIGRQGYSVFRKGYGTLSWGADSPAATPDRGIYDIASLTKVVGTTTAIMLLYDEGRLSLSDPVAKYIPEFKGGNKSEVTIEHLLTHHSGLPAGRELWKLAKTPAQARKVIIDTKLTCKPGRCFVYSDLGADMLGFVVEAITKKKLDAFLTERVFTPLAMQHTMFRPARDVRASIAPTEVSPPRGYRIQGEVHDESAFTLGGVAGHAGLFSTADDLSVFAQMLLNKGTFNGVRIVAESTVNLFTARRSGTRALGWDTANGEGGAGDYLSSRAYGHTGYTGTSLWIDPERELFVILLTNRVHAPRVRQPGYLIADVRNDIGDAAAIAVTDVPVTLPKRLVLRSDTATYWDVRVVRKGTRRAR